MSKESREEKRKHKAELAAASRSFSDYPFLQDIKPNEKYVFHSDYFEIDGRVATIMGFFHLEGAQDNFGAFWGVNRVPSGLDSDVQIILFEQNKRMSENWIKSHQSYAEGLQKNEANETSRNGSLSAKGRSAKRAEELQVIAQELQNGAAYMHIQFRIMVTAPTLEKLDNAVERISRLYIDRFATLHAAPYPGEQRKELSTLFARNEKKLGKGFYMTGTEYAGAYSLVTHGIEDAKGEYVGSMVGDVNNAAVLFEVNHYGHHVVIADEAFTRDKNRMHASACWGSKMSQACLLHGGRVVHLILDATDLDQLGPKFDTLTFRLDLNRGDVNMFEMFGERKDQLSIFPAQMQKLVLMAEQAYETTDSDRSIIRGSLEKIATQYYIDQRMWYENAEANADRLRIVGIPHEEVPKLEMFCSYLDMEYKKMANASAKDNEQLHALNILSVTFKNLLSNNGDLFNTTTSDSIDGTKTGRRVIYDFSDLMKRGIGIAMAQLVNTMGFAVNSLGRGDVVIIHGADKIDDGIKDYMSMQFSRLYEAGGRVVYIYNDVERMLSDKSFCAFDKADYSIFGNMTFPAMKKYQELVGESLPADLVKLITGHMNDVNYIRRGFDNVVFRRDLSLGLTTGKGWR